MEIAAAIAGRTNFAATPRVGCADFTSNDVAHALSAQGQGIGQRLVIAAATGSDRDWPLLQAKLFPLLRRRCQHVKASSVLVLRIALADAFAHLIGRRMGTRAQCAKAARVSTSTYCHVAAHADALLSEFAQSAYRRATWRLFSEETSDR